MTRYLLMPLRPVPLILVAVFTVIWAYAIKGRIFGIPADLILISWFFKYCYVLLDTVVAGQDELPVLSVEMLNPVDEQRPLLQAIMVSLGFLASWWVYHAVGPVAGLTLGALLLTALPATVGLLAISDSWAHALSPVAVGRVMKGLGWTYLGVLTVTLGGAALIVTLALTLGSILLILALSQLVFMAMFCFVGGALFERRVDLQLATRTYGERMAERDERHHADDRAAVLDRSYALLRLKRRREAWANLESWIREHCPDAHPFTEYHALLQATCSWEDPSIGDRVASEYLGRLLANGETGLALDALQIRLNSNPGYYPAGEAYAGRLAGLAAAAGRKALSRQLLANAAEPGKPAPTPDVSQQ
ncbi:MAG TPA: hypothetical protein VMC02_09775 [Steroidobacteraceae bacterium]|nr:hypothetical protein [Steroidobacteraceae bacterium]